MAPNKVIYNVVKNNKTPNGPIVVGEVRFSIKIKTASPIMLIEIIMRLCFMILLYHKCCLPPSIFMEGGGGYPALKILTIDLSPDPPFPFDRFTLGEALSLLVFPFALVYVFCVCGRY